MKKLKISVLAVIAVLAISVTATVKAGFFDTKVVDDYECSETTPGDLESVTFVNCPGVTQTLQIGDNCTGSGSFPNRFVCARSITSTTAYAQADDDCTGTAGQICCLRVLTSQPQCDNNVLCTSRVIVICKPD